MGSVKRIKNPLGNLPEGFWITGAFNDWLEITWHVRGDHIEYVEVYVKEDGDGWFLTDGGCARDRLGESECSCKDFWRKQIAEICEPFGVQLDPDDELVTTATDETFNERLVALVQASIKANGLYCQSGRGDGE